MLASVHGAVRLGLDRELCVQLAQAGLADDAITAIRFRGSGREYSVILPTYRTWRYSRFRDRVRQVGLLVQASGRAVLVVPPSDVQQEPRLANAHHIFQEKLVPACEDAGLVTSCIENLGGEAPLAACEVALASPLARGRVFGLIYTGYIKIDLTIELTDRTAVYLRQPCWKFDWAALGWSVLQSDDADRDEPSGGAAGGSGSH